MTSSSISKAERGYIQSSLKATPPLRADVLLETGVAPLANGSAKLNIGKATQEGGGGTEILAATKLEVEDVELGDGVDGGRLACSVTCSPSAYPHLSANALDELQYDLTTILHQTLSHPSLILTTSCRPRRLTDSGNVVDALFMAARAALWDTKVPRTRPIQYQARKFGDTLKSTDAMEVEGVPVITSGEVLDGRDRWPVCVTLNMLPSLHFLDATLPEEASTPIRLFLVYSFPLKAHPSLQAMRLTGSGEVVLTQLKTYMAKYARSLFEALEAKPTNVKARDKFAVR
ncbi:uncharacterized protein B0H18DRAFT_997850 [Fomitopsis serialis]|uniref:uncharacterized protein n=1 Tax=Fomitopsis serialis TaxID=139415 RepID=UPI0020078086|nr:uncharacterized protein B0H18DRAFT_997850 [Neoantrodia serialis]KAH9929162.1 hypothetical protein B0H18DRAFT_997850 [Neoantrodia serialis]